MSNQINALPGPLNDLLKTMQFFTRIPLPDALGERVNHDEPLGSAAWMFPVAGILIGLVPAITWLLAVSVLPPLAAAGFAIAAGMVITGALHEDGFADCADGLGGGSTRERALEIMRDSRIGAFGAAALVFTIGMRTVLLASLAPWLGFFAIIACHGVARAAMSIAMKTTNYARPEGLGKSVDGSMDNGGFWLGLLLASGLAFLLAGTSGLLSTAIAFAAAWAILQWIKARLGGYTGDGLGAMEQVAEIAFLASIVALWT